MALVLNIGQVYIKKSVLHHEIFGIVHLSLGYLVLCISNPSASKCLQSRLEEYLPSPHALISLRHPMLHIALQNRSRHCRSVVKDLCRTLDFVATNGESDEVRWTIT